MYPEYEIKGENENSQFPYMHRIYMLWDSATLELQTLGNPAFISISFAFVILRGIHIPSSSPKNTFSFLRLDVNITFGKLFLTP